MQAKSPLIINMNVIHVNHECHSHIKFGQLKITTQKDKGIHVLDANIMLW